MDKRYQSERHNPLHRTHTNHLKLTFDGSYLTLYAGSRIFKYPAVSGVRNKKGGFCYCKSVQNIADQGPIPEGQYWIQLKDLWQRGWKNSIVDLLPGVDTYRSWGNFRFSIHPFSNTIIHGRGGFFIHGGTIPGSKGCIDLTTKMDQFVKDLVGEAAGASIETHIHLTVNYSTTVKCTDCSENILAAAGKAKLTYYIREAILEGIVAGEFIQILAVSGGGAGKTDRNYASNLPPEEPYFNNPTYTGIRKSSNEGIRGGPLPTYHYIIGKPEHNKAILTPTQNMLTPVSGATFKTETGRDGGFQIHGRGAIGSDGCIVPLVPAEFHRLMEGLKKDGGGLLTVKDSMQGDEIGPKSSKFAQ